jgi:hypothetical protein
LDFEKPQRRRTGKATKSRESRNFRKSKCPARKPKGEGNTTDGNDNELEKAGNKPQGNKGK